MQPLPESVVIPVNCVGVMGKGLALYIKMRWPDVFSKYQSACRTGLLKPGRVFSVPIHDHGGIKEIINLPTKRHWKDPSLMEDIKSGCQALRDYLQQSSLKSVAVPALGCGNGQLSFEEVRPIIEAALSELPQDCYVFLPD